MIALRALRDEQEVFPTLGAVLAYVPTAVGFVDDDLDLPLPEPDFPNRIQALLTRAPARHSDPPTITAVRPLPARPPAPPRTDAITEANAEAEDDTVVHT
ncbi:hypothetical protein ABZY36_32875 [Streptomyces sp. NPDC006627]|uniref:hypothetical protein n=1 Tax=Streptomyces sp. NPDC006627 TaxID=3154679 RepID=UPI0033A75062